MAANISAIRANVRKDLHDEDSSNYRWTDAVLDRHIARAVVEYSIADPLEQKTTLTATPGSRELSIAALTNVVDVENVEWPTGEFPPRLVGTASGLQASRMADLWIASYEHRRTGGLSVLRLHLEGGWEILHRNTQRTQIVHTSDAYLTVLLRIFSRAGLQLTSSAVSTRAQTVAPKFTIAPDASGFDSVRRALAYRADRIRMRTIAGATITEPLASAASDYTFGTNHPLREVSLLSEPPRVTEAQAFGAGAFGEAIDFANAALSIGTREDQRDLTSATGATAAATATAHLRQRALDTPAGEIIVPPNCGQELLDAIDFTDALISPSAIKRRVTEIRWRYNRRKAQYEQTIRLGAM